MCRRLFPTLLPCTLYSGKAGGSFVLVPFLWFVSLGRQRNEQKNVFNLELTNSFSKRTFLPVTVVSHNFVLFITISLHAIFMALVRM